jgi:hypothetical protein
MDHNAGFDVSLEFSSVSLVDPGRFSQIHGRTSFSGHQKDFWLFPYSVSRICEEQVEVRGRMRTHKSLYETAYAHATIYGVTPEYRDETGIRSRLTQFLSSAPG